MPRPNIDPELLAKWDSELTEGEKNLPSGMAHVYANPAVRAKLHEIGLAGKWLQAELEKDKVEEEKIEKFCFAFGQRCFMAPDVWELALKTVDLFRRQQLANPPAIHVTRDCPEDERTKLFEIYTKVHSS